MSVAAPMHGFSINDKVKSAINDDGIITANAAILTGAKFPSENNDHDARRRPTAAGIAATILDSNFDKSQSPLTDDTDRGKNFLCNAIPFFTSLKTDNYFFSILD